MSERGRPSTYKPEYAELARKFCTLGATNDDLATCFEVARGTIDYWIKTQPDFAVGVQRGRDLADVGVVEKLYSRHGLQHRHQEVRAAPRRGEGAQADPSLSARRAGLHVLAAQPAPSTVE